MSSSRVLMPVFQLIQDVRSNQFFAAEVLARWHENGVLIGPHQNPDVDWVAVDIATVSILGRSAELCQMFLPALFINVSEELLASDTQFARWLQIVEGIIKSKRVRITIEITELIPDVLLHKRWLQLKSLGAEMALDDYGQDFSSFARLTDYSWDYCKFSAQRLIEGESMQAALYCMSKKIKCVTEQIETQQQSSANLELGLWLQQGYFHHKPVTFSEYISKLKG